MSGATCRRIVAAAALAVLLARPARSKADTIIEGGDVGGQVWTPAGSPYVVRALTDRAHVPVGTELRIEAGTTVLFSRTTGNIPALDVGGTLTISGTAGAPVTLQGEPGATADNVWQGIGARLCDTGTNSCLVTTAAVIHITGAIIRNAAFGVDWNAPGDVTIDRTTFESCMTAIRVSDFRRSGRRYVFDSLVLRQNKNGLEAMDGAPVTVTNALVQGNTGHGLIGFGASLTVINSTVDGNQSGVTGWWTGASDSVRAVVDVQNTIFSGNRRAIDLDDANGRPLTWTVTESTFWGNTANVSAKLALQVVTVPGANPPEGAGNVVADPKYLSATNLHLVEGSPCIDSGGAARAPDHDLDQLRRPQGSMVDRGAYEFASGGGTGGASGATGTAGTTGSAGTTGTAGTTGAAGTPETGGSAGTAGAAGAAGAAGTAGAAGGRAGGGGFSVTTATDDDGCGCDVGGAIAPGSLGLLAAGVIVLASRRRRR